MPSTILNIWDILQNWKSVTKMNEDISWLYICYQVKTKCCITMSLSITTSVWDYGWHIHRARRHLHGHSWWGQSGERALNIFRFIYNKYFYLLVICKVFGVDPLLSLALNILPLGTYCLACYYTPSKFQLALAKVLTLGYTMLMLAVYLGLVVQVSEYPI